MLKYIKIKGLESHKDSYYEFSPNVNLFVGISNAGKSSVIRAICICAFNRWEEEMLNGKVAEIELGSDKGIVNVRKGKNINEWVVTEFATGQKYEYDKIGKTIPEVVTKVLGMPELQWSDITETPNVMFQLDKHYLISEIDGKRCTSNMFARVVDNVLGLGGTEELIKDISTDGASNKRKYNSNVERIEQLRKKLHEESKIDAKKKILQKMVDAKLLQDKMVQMKGVMAGHAVLSEKLKKMDDRLAILKRYEPLIKSKDVLEDVVKKHALLVVDYGKSCALKDKLLLISDRLKLLVKYEPLNKIRDDVEQKEKTHRVMNELYSQYKGKQEAFEKIKLGLSVKPVVTVDIDALKSKTDFCVKIKESLKQYKTKSELLALIEKNILSQPKVTIDINELKNRVDIYVRMKMMNDKLLKLKDKDTEHGLNIRQYNVSYDNFSGQLDRLKKEIGFCPLCNEPYKEGHKQHG